MPRVKEPPVIHIDEGRYGRAIRAAAYVGAFAGGLVGLGISVALVWNMGSRVADSAKGLRGVIGAPILLAALGSALGIATLCLVAPASYLKSRQGRRWMNVVGTETVIGGRIVCLIVLTFLTTLLVGAMWIAMKLVLEETPPQ